MEKDTIIAVLVLYKTKFSMAKTVQTLSKSMAIVGWTRLDIVVYDNSPEYNTSFIDNEKDNIYFAIHYIADYSNSGVSKAYNITARLGRTLNKKYLLLLDQDTEIALSFCKTISMIRGSYPLIFPILVNDGVIISPCKYQFGRGSSLSANECTEGLKRINNKNFLNSGAILLV